MSIFYRGPRVLITHEVFEVSGAGRRRYAVRDLRRVRIVRRDPPGDGPQRFMGLSALVGAVLVVPLVGSVSALLTGVVLIALSVCAVISLRPRPLPTWELVALYRGRPTAFFRSRDRHEFEQVCRGLQRCLEQLAEPD